MSKPKKMALGKGLGALIPEVSYEQIEKNLETGEQLRSIPLNQIYPNVNQPRKDFDQGALQELADSIKVHGLIQPIVVSEEADGFCIIAGERRWRAAMLLQLREIPCIVRALPQNQILEVALIENLQREDLNPVEEAQAYRQLIEKHGITQEKLSEALGKSRPYLANMIRLLQLDERVLEMIQAGRISAGHGRVLLRETRPEHQLRLALQIEKEGLNVRQVEKLLTPAKKASSTSEKRPKEFFIQELEDQLKKFFGTKVSISKGPKKGKIEIEYYSEEDLERILELLDTK